MLHEELDTPQDQFENEIVRFGRCVALGYIKTVGPLPQFPKGGSCACVRNRLPRWERHHHHLQSLRISSQLLGFGIERLPSVSESILNAELPGLAQHQQRSARSEAGFLVALVPDLSSIKDLKWTPKCQPPWLKMPLKTGRVCVATESNSSDKIECTFNTQ